MADFFVENMRGERVRSVEDWRTKAAPQGGDEQWRDGRSAKELAKAWCRGGAPAVPSEFAALLESHPATRGIVLERGIAEKVTRLDAFNPGHRNHDLVLVGRANDERIVIAVEAKADESFGSTVAEALAAAQKRIDGGLASNLRIRVAELCRAILNCSSDAAHALRYQLIYALAGTLIEARQQGARIAAFVVHEFETSDTKDERHAKNHRDLCNFFARLQLDLTGRGSILLGPIAVPGGDHVPSGIPLYVGKVTTNLRGMLRQGS